MTLTTHVLDTSIGAPASGIAIALHAVRDGTHTKLAEATTNDDGRTDAPLAETLQRGRYELTFSVASYFARRGVVAFYDEITIRFVVDDERHHHVPLLLAPWSYSTYRGS